VYVYRCETTSSLPRLDASGVTKWRIPHRRRHQRRSGHFHVRGDKKVTWYFLAVKNTYCPPSNNQHQLVSGSRHNNVCTVLHDVVFVQVPGCSGEIYSFRYFWNFHFPLETRVLRRLKFSSYIELHCPWV